MKKVSDVVRATSQRLVQQKAYKQAETVSARICSQLEKGALTTEVTLVTNHNDRSKKLVALEALRIITKQFSEAGWLVMYTPYGGTLNVQYPWRSSALDGEDEE